MFVRRGTDTHPAAVAAAEANGMMFERVVPAGKRCLHVYRKAGAA